MQDTVASRAALTTAALQRRRRAMGQEQLLHRGYRFCRDALDRMTANHSVTVITMLRPGSCGSRGSSTVWRSLSLDMAAWRARLDGCSRIVHES